MENPVDVASMTPRECYEYARSLGLGSRSEQKRERAEVTIRAMGMDAVDFLLQVSEVLQQRKRRARIIDRLSGTPLIIVGLVIACFVPAARQHSARWWVLGLGVAMPLVGVAYALLLHLKHGQLEFQVHRMLLEYEDRRTLNYLLKYKWDWLSLPTDEVLNRMLTEINRSDSGVVSVASRSYMVGLLRRVAAGQGPFDDQIVRRVLAVISCLQNLGEPSVTSVMESLAVGVQLPDNAISIRDAARKALPSFRRASEAHRISGTLLRSTESPATSDILVRPASAGNDDSVALLVRPAGSETTPD